MTTFPGRPAESLWTVSLPDRSGHVTGARAAGQGAVMAGPAEVRLVLGPGLRQHLRRMLLVYEGDLRRNGVSLPPELGELLQLVTTANGGHIRGDRVTIAPRRAEAVLMTYDQAAEMLGRSPRTVRRMVARRQLRAVGSGSGRRIPAAEVARYVRRAA